MSKVEMLCNPLVGGEKKRMFLIERMCERKDTIWMFWSKKKKNTNVKNNDNLD